MLLASLATSIVLLAAPADAVTTPAAYSQAVTQICAHALLFDGTHAIGTRAGAVETARDIRASTRGRLARVAALRTPPVLVRHIAHWLLLERRLADAYASSYVGIYDVLEAARTPEQRARVPQLLAGVMHAPDPLRKAAARLEERLHVPDCTGGAPRRDGPEGASA